MNSSRTSGSSSMGVVYTKAAPAAAPAPAAAAAAEVPAAEQLENPRTQYRT
jgi:hypothetical protein